MSLRLFNTLTRSIQPFTPLDPAARSVGMYCCGPTVHDYAHIGNFRTFVFADLVRRYLQFRGYGVHHVMNITDVEDKILRRARESNMALRDFTGRFEKAFLEDFDALLCRRPHALPRATEHIPEMIAIIQRLVDRSIAYRTADGSVYFNIERYRACGCQYGRLVHLNSEALRPGERVASDEYEKESAADFALWKARVPEDGDVFWESPWGQGRPGWHIECSAMSMKLLGESFDLHLGGEDLVFPHHEDEIAQSEGATGRPFVRHWMHGAHLLVEGKKMSKSMGNYFTLRDLLAKGFTGREIRHLLLTAHYRESFNFTLDGLVGARAALSRIDECLAKLREVAADTEAPPDAAVVDSFTAALDEDLNMSAGWAVIFDWVRDCNRTMASGQLSRQGAATALASWQRLDDVLGLGSKVGEAAPQEMLVLLDRRNIARKAKDFALADALRDELRSSGWAIEDTAKGARLKRL